MDKSELGMKNDLSMKDKVDRLWKHFKDEL